MSHPEPDAQLTFLRRLVTVLTATMIAGVLLIVALLVIRLTAEPTPLTLPPGLTLPDGTQPQAVTLTPSRVLIVGSDGQLYIHDRANGTLLQRLPLTD